MSPINKLMLKDVTKLSGDILSIFFILTTMYCITKLRCANVTAYRQVLLLDIINYVGSTQYYTFLISQEHLPWHQNSGAPPPFWVLFPLLRACLC